MFFKTENTNKLKTNQKKCKTVIIPVTHKLKPRTFLLVIQPATQNPKKIKSLQNNPKYIVIINAILL